MISPWMFASYLFIPLSVGMFPHLFQHWLTARSARTFRLTVVAHPIFIAIVWVPCVLIGVWAAAMAASGELMVPNPNAALARMVATLVESELLVGLLMAGILAAIMSSLDSQFVCLGTMFTNDVVVRLFGKDRFSDRQLVWIARGFVVGVVAVAYGLSMALLEQSVFDLGVWCFSGFASAVPAGLRRGVLETPRHEGRGDRLASSPTVLTWLAFFDGRHLPQGHRHLRARRHEVASTSSFGHDARRRSSSSLRGRGRSSCRVDS